jgi:mRNA interferase HigB
VIVVRRDIVERYLARRAGTTGIAVARSSYDAWLKVAEASAWRTPIDAQRSHPKASILKGGRAVFNINGNDYRLVVRINYRAGTVEIRFFGTHREYDGINAETI